MPMNLWTDDNGSVMEAFMSSDLTGLWPPSQSSASTSTPPIPDPSKALAQSQPQVPPFNQETLQQRLQVLIEGARESWTYAIFWQSSYEYPGAAVLGWGDGLQKIESCGKLVSSRMRERSHESEDCRINERCFEFEQFQDSDANEKHKAVKTRSRTRP
ncbi:hypothetical protein SLEP1_g58808 [Rubroshorea leprosula]|uniref:Transcription factor n=1 Tax=Rubroshorea leprosula TaxID=152421 RepID=A0AAV5MRL9_9ROSI|nr:hypothetical protein SLEP1_g58808 [Rubroshorea leprosula]